MKQTLILTGDIHLGHVADPTEPFALVADVLGEADVVFGNLEGCLYDPSVTVDYKPGWTHVGPEPAPALRYGGFHAVGCANNVNFGADAIMATLELLNEMKIAHTGAGADRAQARTPAIVERDGVRFGFLQYTSVFWPIGHEATAGSPGVAAILAHTAYRPNSRIAEMPGGPPIIVTWGPTPITWRPSNATSGRFAAGSTSWWLRSTGVYRAASRPPTTRWPSPTRPSTRVPTWSWATGLTRFRPPRYTVQADILLSGELLLWRGPAIRFRRSRGLGGVGGWEGRHRQMCPRAPQLPESDANTQFRRGARREEVLGGAVPTLRHDP